MKRFSVALIALILVLMAVLPAAAAGPEVYETWVLDEDWPIGLDYPEWNCEGYPIIDHIVADGGLTLWKDKAGNPSKMVAELKGHDNLFTEAYPEIVISGNFGWKETYTDWMGGDNADGYPMFRYSTWRGVDWNIQVPGQGVVIHNVGQTRWDYSDQSNSLLVKRAGLEMFDLPTLCQALGFDQ